MVANVHKGNTKGANLKSALDYNLVQGKHAKEKEEKKPEIVISNNITGTTSSQITKEFKNVSDQNTNKNFKNKEFHFSISFPPGDQTPKGKRIEAVEKSIQNFGVDKDNFQYVAVEHFDKPHPHFHISINRVGFDGETLNTKNDYAKLQKALDRTEKEMGLDNSMAEKRRFLYDKESEKGYKYQAINQNTIKKPREKSKKLEERKTFIQKKIDEALRVTKVKNAEELKIELQKSSINFEYTADAKGLKGTSFKTDQLALKGSNIGFKASVINAQLKLNENYSSLDLKGYHMEDVAVNRNEIKKVEPVQTREQNRPKAEEKKQEIESQESRKERFKRADLQINIRVEKKIGEGELRSFGSDIDPILREEIGKEFPKENIWGVIEELGERNYQNKLNDKVEKLVVEKTKKHEQQPKNVFENQNLAELNAYEEEKRRRGKLREKLFLFIEDLMEKVIFENPSEENSFDLYKEILDKAFKENPEFDLKTFNYLANDTLFSREAISLIEEKLDEKIKEEQNRYRGRGR